MPRIVLKSYPPSEEMPENQEVFECSECSEMNFALTPALGGCNQWICGLATLVLSPSIMIRKEMMQTTYFKICY